MRFLALAIGVLAGCASDPGMQPAETSCGPEVERLSALLAAEVADRQRATRTAARREEALRKQLDAMKSIERGILDRDDRGRSVTRQQSETR